MSAFLTASCAAALAALHAATAAPVLAVALSLSKPSQYHFVSIPEGMTNFTGSGMGSGGASGEPIRYEDIAFLTEAFAERRSLGKTNVTATTLSQQLGPQADLFIGNVGKPFVRADLSIDQTFRKAEDFLDFDEGWNFAFFGVSNAVPASSSDELYYSVMKQMDEQGGSYRYTNTVMKAVDSRWFAAAYEDVAKLTRVMPQENWGMRGESTVTESNYYKDGQYWNGHAYISEANPLRCFLSTNYVMTVSFPMLWMQFTCWREKYRVASTSAGKWNEWSNGDVTEDFTYGDKKKVVTSDSNGLKFDTGIAALGGRTVKSGVLLAYGDISVIYDLNDHADNISTNGRFLVGYPVTTTVENGKIFCVAKDFTSETALQNIAKRVCALYSLTYCGTVTALLGLTKKPEDPDPAEYANYWKTTEEGSNEYQGKYYTASKNTVYSSYYLYLRFSGFRLVLDIDFNARTYGGDTGASESGEGE